MSEACLHMTQLILVTSKENVPKAKGKGREEPVMANIPLSLLCILLDLFKLVMQITGSFPPHIFEN